MRLFEPAKPSVSDADAACFREMRAVADALVRPATRGELAARLRKGEACEVAAHVAEMTSIMLEGWLECSGFTVTDSPNQGWVIYWPAAADTPTVEQWLQKAWESVVVDAIDRGLISRPANWEVLRETSWAGPDVRTADLTENLTEGGSDE